MRRSRWLILAAILFIVVAVGAIYVQRKVTLARDVPPPPAPLESGVDGRANDWVYTQSDGDKPRVTVRAKSFRQIQAPSVMELDGVELQIFHKDGTQFDLVKSAKAQFDIAGKTLYSDGDVEITMGVPQHGAPSNRIVKIHSSGVHFASDTGRATTDRDATFEFDRGGGSATGAEYDPQMRELHLLNDVALHWKGRTKKTPPMNIEAAEAIYKESESKVFLQQWSKLKRGTLSMDAGNSTFTLENGEIKLVDAEHAKGVQNDPTRKIEFAAELLTLNFAKGMTVNNIKGEGDGKLISTAKTLRTTVTGNLLFLTFQPTQRDSVLSLADAKGKAVVEAQPIAQKGELTPDTRILRSEYVHLRMRAGGEEIDNVETEGPGTVDFLPNRPNQPKRFLKGDKIWIAYGAGNRIQSFRTINASTRTDKPGQPAPMLTQSKELVASFDPSTSELSRLEQKTDFRYEEGTRKATADRATLEQAKDLMNLDGSARVADPTGSASADHITMNQKSGDVVAEGRVATTRLPDQKGPSSAMLSNAEVMQGRSQRMTSSENNQKLHYEGNAVVWQGANRVEADRVDIDRTRHAFEAHGKVNSQFVDKAKENDKGKDKTIEKSTKTASPVFTVVRAADLVYDEQTRVANYQGGAALTRPGLNVTGKEIQAYLKDSDSDSSLDKAFANGTVKIVSVSEKRTRTGTAEHGEYYADEQKVILNTGDPILIDSVTGQTKGRELTWWANNDRLLVNGVESHPADSLLRKK
jgi:lipopolysaccharide export system protein LptA